MKPRRVCALFFSPTGGTRRAALLLAEELAAQFGVGWEEFRFTTPKERDATLRFGQEDLVVCLLYTSKYHRFESEQQPLAAPVRYRHGFLSQYAAHCSGSSWLFVFRLHPVSSCAGRTARSWRRSH